MDDRPQKVQGSSPSGSIQEEVESRTIEELDQQLKEQFAEEIRDLARPKYQPNVAVLLLSWAVENEDQLDTSEEIRDLRTVFQDMYNFTVYERLLTISPGTPAKHQLNNALSELLANHDRKDTLLIIYYGGHGIRGSEDGGLKFARGNSLFEDERKLSEIAWSSVSTQLEDTNADRLLIFDCCHAGLIDRMRSPKEHPIYEFIGSTPFNRTAIGPSDRSFTRALINSLTVLSGRTKGFSTWELLSEIKKAPDFIRSGQEPVSSELGPHASFRKLQIRRLSETTNGESDGAEHDENTLNRYRCCLTLTYMFTQKPTEAHVTALTKSLQQLVVHEGVPIKRMTWIGLRKWTFKDMVDMFTMKQRRSLSLIPDSQQLTPTPVNGGVSPLNLASTKGAVLEDDIELIAISAPARLVRPKADSEKQMDSSNRWRIVDHFASKRRRLVAALFVFSLGVTFAKGPELLQPWLRQRW